MGREKEVEPPWEGGFGVLWRYFVLFVFFNSVSVIFFFFFSFPTAKITK